LLAITRATSDETHKEIADVFCTSSNTISDIKNRLVAERVDERVKTTVNTGEELKRKRDREKLERLGGKKESIHELALDNLVLTLQSLSPKLSPENASGLKVEKLSMVARDMSKVVSNLENKNNKNDEDESKAPRIILFAPNLKQENYYETIDG